MTDEELAVIKARAEAATPGPWSVYEGDDYEVRDGKKPAGMIWQPAWSDEDPEDEELYPFTRHEADAAFIAHAREDIPALLAEVERLRAALDVIQGQRRRALGILYQIYELGIDPKNAHTSANVRALLDAAKDVRLD